MNIILKGQYIDHFWNGDKKNPQYKSTIFNPGDFRIVKRDYLHNVEVTKSPTWTLFIGFNKPKRWGFWLKNTLKKMNRDKYFIENGHHIC